MAITVKRITPGTRVLITDRHEYGGAGVGAWRPARTITQKGKLTVPGEPAGVHAATVISVDPLPPGPTGTQARYSVVTNLATVVGVTAAQRFRLAPDKMRDSADIRRELREERARREAQEAYDQANPRDIDGVNVHVGDLVETLDLGGGGCAGRPATILRVLGTNTGALIVASPYERAYGKTYPAGTTGLHAGLNAFRRLADQTGDGPTAHRSCGCPGIIRDQIFLPPADGDVGAWRAAHQHMNEMAAESLSHNEECVWAKGKPRRFVRFVDSTDAAGNPVSELHDAYNSSCGQPCTHGFIREGRTVDVPTADLHNLEVLRAILYPPSLHPDRDNLPSIVQVADCIPLAAGDCWAQLVDALTEVAA